MKSSWFLLTMFLLLTMFACKKENDPVNIQASQTIAKEFDTCRCSVLNVKGEESQYIKAEINGVPMCFDQSAAVGDTFPNMLKHGFIIRDTGNQYYDNLYMIRNAKNSRWQAAMFFENTYALTKKFPYELPRANSEVCEIGEFQLNNLDHYAPCAWCPENAFNYYGPFWGNSLKMTVLSFHDNVFEGVFSGRIRTGSGKTVIITNGRFKIKLVVFKSDIKVPY